MSEFTHLSLFSGIGGLDIAAEWAGFKTVGQCEWADYPRAVLEKHWPGLPRWRDIRTLTKESFYEQTGLRTITVLSGGFPCQPFSTAGKRRGKDDDRYLWPEMLRVIQEIRPRWVVGENVAGIVTLALDQVLSDLESIGYTCQAVIIPACAVDAPHRRDRCAIVGNSNEERRNKQQPAAFSSRTGEPGSTNYTSAFATDPNRKRFQNSGHEPKHKAFLVQNRITNASWRKFEPGVGGMVDGVSCWMDEPGGIPRINGCVRNRVNRIQCLGNAVVPQQFYPIFRAIAELEAENERP